MPWVRARSSGACPGAVVERRLDADKARRHLSAADPALGALIARIGPFAMELKSSRSLFGALAEAIVY